jgi:hypothetical protein
MSKRRADGTTILKPGEEADLRKNVVRGDMDAVAKLEEAGKPVGAVPVAIGPEPSAPPAPEGGRKRRRTMKKRKVHRRKTHHRRR